MDSLEPRRLLATTLPDGFGESMVASGLNSPTAMAFAPDGRLFVALKGGELRVIKNGALLPTPFVTLPVDTFSERGLGGIAFDPDFENNNFVYTYYTANSPTIHNRVSRFVANGDVAVPGSEQVILDLPPPLPENSIHNGGSLQFAPDGTLFIAVGEQGSGADVHLLTHPFGKILRINSDGTIPSDNPFFNTTTGVNRAIWATGLRNPFTTAFQPGTGRFYINDVGQDAWEEINLGAPGANYGWTQTEGEFDPLQYPAFTNPIYTYPHPEGWAITGGVFYNPANAQFPAQYVGQYFFADYVVGFIRYMDPESFQVSEFATGAGQPVDLDIGPEGALYYLSRATDSVYKISATQAPAMVTQPQSQLTHTGDPVTFTVAASGQAPLSYQWQRNGTDITGATASSYTIDTTVLSDDGDTFRCIISNTHGQVTSNNATLDVTDDTPPAPAIAVTSTFRAGQTISFTGGAFDIEDGLIPASNMTWEVVFHHNIHTHPHVAPFSGATGGSFLVPTVGHTAPDVWYRVHLTVTDSAGFTRSTYRDVLPVLQTVTLQTNVPGLSVALDGQPQESGTSVTSVRGLTRVLTALPTQVVNGVTYEFVGWSDGGAATHAVVWPESPTTYMATYAPKTIDYISDIDPSSQFGTPRRDNNAGGWGMLLDTVAYAKGVGMLGTWDATYDIAGRYDTFTARIGVDDFIGNSGTVIFQVWTDGTKVFDSGVVTGSMPSQAISVDVTGAQQLKLVLGFNDDDLLGDWGNWADAKLHADAALTPLKPSQVAVATPFYNRAVISWSDRSSNEQGFEIQRSSDGGTTYSTIGSVGLGVTSYIDNGLTGSAQYQYRVRAINGAGGSAYTQPMSVTMPAYTLPGGWIEADIGTMLPVDRGNTSYDNGTYTIRAGGLGVYSEADSFHFVYRTLVGDGEIVARIVETGTNSAARAGVMMRESLDPGSREAYSFLIDGGNPGFIWRPNTNSQSYLAPTATLPLPGWVKLKRIGGTIIGYNSLDGVTWDVIAAMTINPTAPLYVGLAMTSWYPGVMNYGTFDNVSVSNVAPQVATSASAQLNAGQTAALLSALGSDDGAEPGLTYTWSVIDKPVGAADPIFDINGTNGSRNSVATFDKPGDYVLRVTISDGQLSVTSDVGVTVNPLLTSIAVTPDLGGVDNLNPVQFAAVALDQFGDPLAAQPTFTWGVQGGGGIDANGLFTPAGESTVTISATVGAVSGSVVLAIDVGGPNVDPITSLDPAPGDGTWTFNVTYVDATGIDVTTLGNDDIIVTAPDGTPYAAVLLDFSPAGNGSPRLATYRIVLNDMMFDSTDNGEWTVNLVPGSVTDVTNNPVTGGEIHTFIMEAPPAVVNQNGELIITGTNLDDSMTLDTTQSGDILVTVNGVEVVIPSSAPQAIIIHGFNGNDTLNIDSTIYQAITFTNGFGAGDNLVLNSGQFDATVDLNGMNVTVNVGALISFNTTQHLNSLNILDGMAVIGTSTATLVTDTFTVSQAGCMDVNGAALIVHQGELGSWDGGYTGLTGMVAYGRDNGNWILQGISSSAAANSGGMNDLAIARAGDLLGLSGAATDVWRGETVSADSILIRFTWSGDADLNGELNGDDYFYLDSNVLQSGSVFGFHRGDFNYDGELNGDDYFWIDSTILFAQSSEPL